ncbi:class I SAM-dependent methyltransferase [Candidatus Woesebacteria bacterium]|nr:MAG: class I SAM-dependent methyltransferase [Candidatus Woesebacteria bacterium]
MSAHYDSYDYPSYWEGRTYEHEAEVSAIKYLLNKIAHIRTVIDIGAGYGRLSPLYIHRARKIILTDPSSKLLKIARLKLPNKKVIFLQAKAETLPDKLRKKSADLVICVRVAHHINDIDTLLKITNDLLVNNGYFIFEFANKRHLKAIFSEFIQGNFTFALDIFPIDLRSKRAKKQHTLPFVNYHPDVIKRKLVQNGFVIKEVLSVSNIRSAFLKKHMSVNNLIEIEKLLRKPFSKFSLGPSVFILARKKGSL